MYQKRNKKRNEKRKKRIEKRNQEEEEREEDWEEEEEEQEEEIRRGPSNKRFVSSCIIEYLSLTFDWLFIYCSQMYEGWRMEDAEDVNWEWSRTWTGTFEWKKMSMKQSVHPQLNLY